MSVEPGDLVMGKPAKRSDMGGWKLTLWGEIATLEYGKSLRGYDSSSGDYKVYGTNGPIGWHSEPLWPFPGVVIGRKGAYRGVHYSPDPFFVIDTAFYLKPKVELDTRWAYYQLLTQNINGMDSGSAIPSTSREDFYGLPVDLPPLPEQRAIAHVLGTLDDKIELNRRMNETLEEIARALFKSWFVDFEPVRAKMEGRWRRGESLPGLPAEHYDLFPDRLVPSEMGEIPEGWEVKEFGTLLDDVIGGDWGKESPDAIHNEPVSIIRGTDLVSLSTGGIGAVPRRYTTNKRAERRVLKEGDIIIEVSGGSPTQPTGRSLLLTHHILGRFSGAAVCASFCRRLRPKSWREALFASRHLDYIYSVGKMWEYQLQSTGIANFQTKRFLTDEKVIRPGDRLLSRFSESIEPIIGSTTLNESLTLAERRDALLPKLVSGEIKINGMNQPLVDIS